ncbi:spore germination protein [Paenibacillus sp. FSL H8-0548]|uniref:spore germination protein n=1 Tax=Paenibacillus sp. FSL H8-0548 TaxID=1920422 RepID=UPI00096C5175|nr:spore germination protein [Paenibacillus sp. FSL H8-0548]OMF22224.1 spore germination protein [Paenibacillus sp. FSL H8-0548]
MEQEMKQAGDPLVVSLQENILKINKLMGHSTDVVVREIRLGIFDGLKACVIFIDGLIDSSAVNNFVLESLMLDSVDLGSVKTEEGNVLQYLKEYVLTSVSVNEDVADYNTMFTSLLSGGVILLIDGQLSGFSISLNGWKERGITEPTSETVIRGPKESFMENIRVNTALIRRKIKTPDLRMETYKIGILTQTDVAIMYINGISNKKIVNEVRLRLKKIDIDSILESSYIEELIQDKGKTPFPTVLNSERPDVIAAELLEGKVAIIVDGTPYVLVVPALFVSFIHSAEDYYHRADIGTFIRLLRYLGIFIGLFAPALFIAITTFHVELIPRTLLGSLSAQREGVPFPAFVEVLIMEITFEILREAGIRMPRNIGQAVSIVGSLVIGTAAVQAGLISPAMVIVVSLTAVANFVIPSNDMSISIRLLRFPFIFLGASFGLFGMSVGFIILILHLTSLRSFGVPYLSPFAPFDMEGQKDSILRVPIRSMLFRPKLIARKNLRRQRMHPPK